MLFHARKFNIQAQKYQIHTKKYFFSMVKDKKWLNNGKAFLNSCPELHEKSVVLLNGEI